MNKTILVVGIGLGLSIFAASYLWVNNNRAEISSKALTATSAIEKVSQKDSFPSSGRQARTKLGPFSHLPQTRRGLPLESDPFVADSIEEQEWLDRNGYPNAEQWKAYSSASDGLLAQAAAGGDEIAAVMLDGRALATGDREAPSRLLKAAQNGSLFSLSLLQAYMAGSKKGNPSLGYSISRVMEMMGDTRIALARDVAFSGGELSPQVRIQAEAEALNMLQQLKKTSKKQPFIDPRPFPINQ